MASSIFSFPTIFFISSFFLISISTPKIIVASPNPSPSSPSLIQKACSNASVNIDTELCLRVLKSVPSATSAKDLLSLSVTIIEAGISNSTNTLAYVETVLNNSQTNTVLRGKGAFQECKLTYGQVVARFNSALGEVKRGEYVAPTYDLLTASTDCIKSCESAMAHQNVEDEIISRANQIVPIFGISAFSVIDSLDQFRPPPPS